MNFWEAIFFIVVAFIEGFFIGAHYVRMQNLKWSRVARSALCSEAKFEMVESSGESFQNHPIAPAGHPQKLKT